jgi:hypothetical protein
MAIFLFVRCDQLIGKFECTHDIGSSGIRGRAADLNLIGTLNFIKRVKVHANRNRIADPVAKRVDDAVPSMNVDRY